MLFIISALRSYPEALMQAVSPKQPTSPERRSKMSETVSPMTTDASTKLFTKRYCCRRELPNDFGNAPCSGMLRNRKKLEKTVRLREALTLHFRENYPGTNRSTLCGILLHRTSHQRECAPILRFMTSRTEIPTFAVINQCFAGSEAAAPFEYLNREEDMGIEGLRTAKESYYPAFRLKKYYGVCKC